MDAGEILTRLSNTLDGYDESVLEVLDDEYLMLALGNAVLEMKKVLRVPVAEIDIAVSSGERGFTLPTSPAWMAWADEATAIRLDPDTMSSEGSWVTLVPEYLLHA